jgi:hypothetical protein
MHTIIGTTRDACDMCAESAPLSYFDAVHEQNPWHELSLCDGCTSAAIAVDDAISAAILADVNRQADRPLWERGYDAARVLEETGRKVVLLRGDTRMRLDTTLLAAPFAGTGIGRSALICALADAVAFDLLPEYAVNLLVLLGTRHESELPRG